MNKTTKVLLATLFALSIAIRLFIALQTSHLEYEGYSTARQIESIRETGLPLYSDELSYGGRERVFSPVYYYFLAAFTFLMPVELAAKIIPTILASLIVFPIFFLSIQATKNEKVSLLAAGFAAFIPGFFNNTINNASIYAAVIPLFFLTAHYFLLTNKDPKHVYKLITCIVILTVLHPTSLILALSLLIYIAFLKLKRFRESSREPEIVLFFLFLVFWLNTVLYKRALGAHGAGALWQNVPARIMEESYTQITFLGSIYSIGLLPIIFGLGAVYISFFGKKRKHVTLMTSIGLTIFLLLWFRVFELIIGLMLLGVTLAALSAYFMNHIYEYLQTVKARQAHNIFLIAVLIIGVLGVIPNVFVASAQAGQVPSENDVALYYWLASNTEKSSTVLVLPREGSAMSYFSNRKNVMDDDYLLVPNINKRHSDILSIYNERFVTSALQKLNYYNIQYIALTEYNHEKSNASSLMFFDDNCIKQIYPEGQSNTEGFTPKAFEVRCVLGVPE